MEKIGVMQPPATGWRTEEPWPSQPEDEVITLKPNEQSKLISAFCEIEVLEGEVRIYEWLASASLGDLIPLEDFNAGRHKFILTIALVTGGAGCKVRVIYQRVEKVY